MILKCIVKSLTIRVSIRRSAGCRSPAARSTPVRADLSQIKRIVGCCWWLRSLGSAWRGARYTQVVSAGPGRWCMATPMCSILAEVVSLASRSLSGPFFCRSPRLSWLRRYFCSFWCALSGFSASGHRVTYFPDHALCARSGASAHLPDAAG